MDEEEKKKKEEEEAGQHVAHTAGKAAATYFGGGLGNKIYDIASQTKAGQAIEKTAGKIVNQAPLAKQAGKVLHKSGALDAADAGIDMASGSVDGKLNAGKGLPKEQLGKQGLENQGLKEDTTKKKASPSSNPDNSNKSEGKAEGESEGKSSSKTFKVIPMVLTGLGCSGPVGCGVLLIVAIVATIVAPIAGLTSFLADVFVIDEENEAEKAELKYYETLEKVQNNAFTKYGVCVDINLIHATLMAGKMQDQSIEEGETTVESDAAGADLINSIDYTQMEKQIDLLANMQIKRTKYILVTDSDGNLQCSADSVAKAIAVDSDNVTVNSDTSLTIDGTTYYTKDRVPIGVAQTPRMVARNDATRGIFSFLQKRANLEKNYSYIVYFPATTTVNGKSTCKAETPESVFEGATISIGDLNTMKDSVYYYNLLDSFISDYYGDLVSDDKNKYPVEGTQRYQEIESIIESIYSFYESIGPSQACASNYGNNVCAEDIIAASCANGVTVTGDNAGVYDLETYIAGVIQRENPYKSKNGSIESAKAQAIAARTYLLNRTNFCQKSIENSTNAQTFNPNPGETAKTAAELTKGLILTYNGSIFSTQYDSFCYNDKDCPDAICNDDYCSVTYTKLPTGEKHIIKIPSNWSKKFVPGAGHARGMSQLLANHMADEGYSYKEILEYFYSDGVKITAMVNSGNEGNADLICKESETPGTGSQVLPNQTYAHFNGEILVQWARKYVGNPYVWGGTSLTNGADCSGFVMTLVKDLFNIDLPHYSKAQVNYGTPIYGIENAKAGDLLFYSNEQGIHHVAIYSGEGTRIHAWSSDTGIVENPVGNPSHIRRLG